MDVSTISNNSLDIQSILLNGSNQTTRSNDKTNQTADYAKKGEPMYMAEMDADGDGTITLDEYREYCKSKGVNTREMINMSKLAASYRTMKAENETIDYISKLIPNVHPNVKQADSSSANQKQNGIHFNTENNNNISYKEYMSYCEQNASPLELKSYTKAEESDDGNLRITNTGKAIHSYEKNDKQEHEGMFETLV